MLFRSFEKVKLVLFLGHAVALVVMEELKSFDLWLKSEFKSKIFGELILTCLLLPSHLKGEYVSVRMVAS